MPVIFKKVESERLDCGAKCREQIHRMIWRDSKAKGRIPNSFKSVFRTLNSNVKRLHINLYKDGSIISLTIEKSLKCIRKISKVPDHCLQSLNLGKKLKLLQLPVAWKNAFAYMCNHWHIRTQVQGKRFLNHVFCTNWRGVCQRNSQNYLFSPTSFLN